MNPHLKIYMMLSIFYMIMGSCTSKKQMEMEVYETSAAGHQLTKISEFSSGESIIKLDLNPDEKYQTITGFGGSFTESSAYLLNKISKENRNKILEAYFSEKGANYSLTRTHIASCDFSLSNYTYAKVENDVELKNFGLTP